MTSSGPTLPASVTTLSSPRLCTFARTSSSWGPPPNRVTLRSGFACRRNAIASNANRTFFCGARRPTITMSMSRTASGSPRVKKRSLMGSSTIWHRVSADLGHIVHHRLRPAENRSGSLECRFHVTAEQRHAYSRIGLPALIGGMVRHHIRDSHRSCHHRSGGNGGVVVSVDNLDAVICLNLLQFVRERSRGQNREPNRLPVVRKAIGGRARCFEFGTGHNLVVQGNQDKVDVSLPHRGGHESDIPLDPTGDKGRNEMPNLDPSFRHPGDLTVWSPA